MVVGFFWEKTIKWQAVKKCCKIGVRKGIRNRMTETIFSVTKINNSQSKTNFEDILRLGVKWE